MNTQILLKWDEEKVKHKMFQLIPSTTETIGNMDFFFTSEFIGYYEDFKKVI